MVSQRLARDLVLGGIVVLVLFAVLLFPIVVMATVWEVSSVRSHWLATFARFGYVLVTLLVGVAAWKKVNVKLAVIFLAMLLTAIALIALTFLN